MQLPKDKTITNLKEYYSTNTASYQKTLAELEQKHSQSLNKATQSVSEYARIERLVKLKEMNRNVDITV